MSNIILLDRIDNHLAEDPLFKAIQTMMTRGYDLPAPAQYKALTAGLINQTYEVDNCWIIQHVNPIFGRQVNEDIAVLTQILSEHQVPVPHMVQAKNGDYCIDGEDYGIPAGPWRIMTKLPGKTCHFVESMEQIQSLAVMIARFHGALNQVNYAFKHTRPGVHDFQRHYKALEKAVETHKTHRLYAKVMDLYERIQHDMKFVHDDKIMSCEDLRIIHGDPKISNFLFDDGAIVGVVDLDTMAKSRVAFDLGDAIRSWCNPRPEDVEPSFDREYAREAMGLYLENAGFLSKAERASLPDAAPFITLELAMRFARDALCEDYFGFNPDIGHGEHSLMRAQSMTALCEQMLEC